MFASWVLGFKGSWFRGSELQQDIQIYDVFCGWAGIFLAARPLLSMELLAGNA